MAMLYDRLGGIAAIGAVVDEFVARCAGDDRINGKFARTDIRSDIVEIEASSTGTPLPESYRNAPPIAVA